MRLMKSDTFIRDMVKKRRLLAVQPNALGLSALQRNIYPRWICSVLPASYPPICARTVMVRRRPEATNGDMIGR